MIETFDFAAFIVFLGIILIVLIAQLSVLHEIVTIIKQNPNVVLDKMRERRDVGGADVFEDPYEDAWAGDPDPDKRMKTI